MMAATLAEGETIIDNAAREPEIVDLANYLNLMGAKVVGAGTETIRIEGVSQLTGTNHSIIPDRIESGTFMMAAAITEGDILIKDCVSEHNRPLISKLREMGVTITEEEKGVRVIGPKELKPTDIKTQPYPGYPTDMQAQMTIAQLKAKGTSVVNETVFENRFMHLEQMRKMNAHFIIDGQSAIINGATLRSRSSFYRFTRFGRINFNRLIAEGHTRVTAINHLDRGYYKLHEKLAALGANIERVSDSEEKIAKKQNV